MSYQINLDVWATEGDQTSIRVSFEGDQIFQAEGLSLHTALIEARDAINRSEQDAA